jgi:hypothetical protein
VLKFLFRCLIFLVLCSCLQLKGSVLRACDLVVSADESSDSSLEDRGCRIQSALSILLGREKGDEKQALVLMGEKSPYLAPDLSVRSTEEMDCFYDLSDIVDLLKQRPDLARGYAGLLLKQSAYPCKDDDFSGWHAKLCDLLIHGKGAANKVAEDRLIDHLVINGMEYPDDALSDPAQAAAWMHLMRRLGKDGQPHAEWMTKAFLAATDPKIKQFLADRLNDIDPGIARAMKRNLSNEYTKFFCAPMPVTVLAEADMKWWAEEHQISGSAKIDYPKRTEYLDLAIAASREMRSLQDPSSASDENQVLQDAVQSTVYRTELPGAWSGAVVVDFGGRCCLSGHQQGGFTAVYTNQNGSWHEEKLWQQQMNLALLSKEPPLLVAKANSWTANWDGGMLEVDEIQPKMTTKLSVETGDCEHMDCGNRQTIYQDGGTWKVLQLDYLKPSLRNMVEAHPRLEGPAWKPIFLEASAIWDPQKNEYVVGPFKPMLESERQALENRPVATVLDALLRDALDEYYLDLGLKSQAPKSL